MKETTIIRLAELISGTSIVIIHALTGANGALIILGALLIGIPAELLVERLKK